MLSSDPDHNLILAYETQARYVSGGGWITIDVSVCHRTAVKEAPYYRDAWGRTPTEVRVVTIHGRRRQAA